MDLIIVSSREETIKWGIYNLINLYKPPNFFTRNALIYIHVSLKNLKYFFCGIKNIKYLHILWINIGSFKGKFYPRV